MAFGKKPDAPKVETPEKPVPVVSVTASPWGEVSEEEFKTSTRDKFYVEGYSNKRVEFDNDFAKTGKGTPLPYRVQYVSVENRANQPTHEKAADYRSRGYQPVLYDDCAKYGINPTLSGFVRGEDGTCRVGSQMLMLAPAKVVAAHAKQLETLNREMSGAAQARMQAATDRWNTAAGPGAERTAPIYEEQVTTERETR